MFKLMPCDPICVFTAPGSKFPGPFDPTNITNTDSYYFIVNGRQWHVQYTRVKQIRREVLCSSDL